MGMSILKSSVILLTVTICTSVAFSQNQPNGVKAGPPVNEIKAGIPVNYDETLVGTYTLPDPLVMLNGEKVKNAKMWYAKRRPEIVSLFEEFQYGRMPAAPKDMSFNVFDKGTTALDGKALKKTGDSIFYKRHLRL